MITVLVLILLFTAFLTYMFWKQSGQKVSRRYSHVRVNVYTQKVSRTPADATRWMVQFHSSPP